MQTSDRAALKSLHPHARVVACDDTGFQHLSMETSRRDDDQRLVRFDLTPEDFKEPNGPVRQPVVAGKAPAFR